MKAKSLCRGLIIAATAALFGWVTPDASAQYGGEAFYGVPFGVGRVAVQLPEGLWPEGLGLAGLGISEKSGRALYPAVAVSGAIPGVVKDTLGRARRPLGRIIGNLLEQVEQPTAEVFFLFQGDAPLDLMVESRRLDAFALPVARDPMGHRRLLERWWSEYTRRQGHFFSRDDHPTLVERYLQAMLSRRLALPWPHDVNRASWAETFGREIGLSLKIEDALVKLVEERMLGARDWSGPADLALPESIATLPEPPQEVGEVEIEPLAMHVPPECFYVRFGSYPNFSWFQDTMARWGGDLANLLMARSLSYDIRQRTEEQLILRETALSRLFGDAVIADVALVGFDTYLAEGASLGMLFYARNSAALAADIAQRRAERMAGGEGVVEEKLEINGKPVSLMTMGDGSLRSYHAADGNYHLVTRSETLVRRFLETSPPESLGAQAGFRHARARVPLSRRDTVFAYLSDRFFQNVVSAENRIELSRRLEALADVELVEMAVLAAAAEGAPADSIEQLVAGGFLPAEFGRRSDGSQAVLGGGDVRDDRRGRRGQFLPLADVGVTAASAREVADYQRFEQYFREHWGQLDPVFVALKRTAASDGRDHIEIDARMTPFSRDNFERLRRLVGPASSQRLAPVAGNIAHGEIVLLEQRAFFGLQDAIGAAGAADGPLAMLSMLRNTLVGYVGCDGPLGPLRILDLGFPPFTDERGMAGGPIRGWRLKAGPFTLYSYHPDLLGAVASQLRYEDAAREAQIRLSVGDASTARVAALINNAIYARSRDNSRGNLRLLHQVEQQLRVPGESARQAAELLLDARLVCPLGGEYAYRQSPEGAGWWMSTALDNAREGSLLATEAPAGYTAPLLRWFRGLDADATVAESGLSIRAAVEMQQ